MGIHSQKPKQQGTTDKRQQRAEPKIYPKSKKCTARAVLDFTNKEGGW